MIGLFLAFDGLGFKRGPCLIWLDADVFVLPVLSWLGV